MLEGITGGFGVDKEDDRMVRSTVRGDNRRIRGMEGWLEGMTGWL